jgi:hypothetical protein
MLTLIAGLMVASIAPNTAMSAAICDVGGVALRDLPTINHNPGFDTYYGELDRDRHGLLEACPKLRRKIPAGYLLADDDARARASIHVPVPGKTIRSAFIYTISLPQISADLKTATVEMGYSCTGLCGGSFVAHYSRTAKGWRREGAIHMTSVS